MTDTKREPDEPVRPNEAEAEPDAQQQPDATAAAAPDDAEPTEAAPDAELDAEASDAEPTDTEPTDTEPTDTEPEAGAEDAAPEDAAPDAAPAVVDDAAAEPSDEADGTSAGEPDAAAVAEPEHVDAPGDATGEAEPTSAAEPEPTSQAEPATEPGDEAEPEPEPPPVADEGAAERTDPLEQPSQVGSEDYLVASAAGAAPARGAVEGKAAWRRMLLMGRPRATRANLLGALLAVLLGAGIAAQVQLTNERGLDELSQSDLIRVLDDVSARSSRLDQQVRELESTRDRLKSGTGTTAEALAQAQKRIDTLGILAGTVGARGQGIVLTITDPDHQVSAPLILDLIQELRDAGAESIDVGGVRVVASSFVGAVDGDILIDGKAVSRPIEVKAIGDSKTLSSAMTIPGGIIETVRQQNAEATVTESQNIEITSIHTPTEFTYAKPAE